MVVLAIIASSIAAAYLAPRAFSTFIKFGTSRAGRIVALWGGFALVWDVFMTGDRQFRLSDAGITLAAALLVSLVL